MFVMMQSERHKADYDPGIILYRSDVMWLIDEAERTMTRFKDTAPADRRAFATHVLFRQRRD